MMDGTVKRADLNNFTIGDVMICSFPNTHSDGTPNGTSKPRPVLIWGVYHDDNDTIFGFDVFEMTTQTQKYNLSGLFTSSDDFIENEDDRHTLINAQNIITLPINLFDKRCGVVTTLDPQFIPDLISCRAHALNSNPGNECLNYMPHHDDCYREGLFLNADLVRPIRSNHNPNMQRPDVDYEPCDDPDFCNESWLNQNEIDAITQWSIAYIDVLRINKMDYSRAPQSVWPVKGTWPNWPDIEINGIRIQCCTSETAKSRDYQPKYPPIYLSAATPRL